MERAYTTVPRVVVSALHTPTIKSVDSHGGGGVGMHNTQKERGE